MFITTFRVDNKQNKEKKSKENREGIIKNRFGICFYLLFCGCGSFPYRPKDDKLGKRKLYSMLFSLEK